MRKKWSTCTNLNAVCHVKLCGSVWLALLARERAEGQLSWGLWNSVLCLIAAVAGGVGQWCPRTNRCWPLLGWCPCRLHGTIRTCTCTSVGRNYRVIADFEAPPSCDHLHSCTYFRRCGIAILLHEKPLAMWYSWDCWYGLPQEIGMLNTLGSY